jgi:hypothetical protein
MVVSTSEARRNRIGQNLMIGEYNFEVVKEFSYLGSKGNCINTSMSKYTTEYSLPIERIMAYATCLHHSPYLGKQSVFFIKH